ncbi:MAG: phosphoglycerate kinase [Ignavibacteriales bacterium]|nr:phosphoglycerate kinase [Ignavibacteriales bacterium]
MNKKTVRDIDFKNKRVIVRVDFNVPMKNGVIQDDIRMRAALPTINYVLEQQPKYLILMSHLGDPKKDVQKAKEKAEKDGKPFDEVKFIEGKCKMKPIAEHLAKLLNKPVKLAPAAIGAETKTVVESLGSGEVLMLENTRFHKQETSKDAVDREAMAKELASYADVFVNDAFGSAHRAHASTETVAKFLPAVAGFLMEKELAYLGKAVSNPTKPFVAIIGGAKIGGKIDVIQNLMNKVDALLIGGGMMFTFYKAQGLEIGKSLLEADKLDVAQKILDDAKAKNIRLLLPTDTVVGDKFDNAASTNVVSVRAIPSDHLGLDIGPETIKLFSEEIRKAKTVVWNGPMGVFEMPNFAKGTNAIAQALADATKSGAVTIVGGGDSASAIAQAGLDTSVSHVSTGGGASLEFLEGKVLPGVAALNDKN